MWSLRTEIGIAMSSNIDGKIQKVKDTLENEQISELRGRIEVLEESDQENILQMRDMREVHGYLLERILKLEKIVEALGKKKPG